MADCAGLVHRRWRSLWLLLALAAVTCLCARQFAEVFVNVTGTELRGARAKAANLLTDASDLRRARLVLEKRNAPSRGDLLARQVDIGGGVDYAIIRFKLPGFDDLSQLPRVVAGVGMFLLVLNRVLYPDSISGPDSRILTEVSSVVLAGLCAILPWMGNRLEEAARRKVSTRSASSQLGCLQTLALEASLPMEARVDVSWTTSVLLRLTNADGLVVWHPTARGNSAGAVCTRGLLKQLQGFSDGPAFVLSVLSSAWRPGAAGSLANGYCATNEGVKNFPAGVLPTSILPGNTESVIVKPLPGGGLLVLWSALPRAFDRTVDRRWVERAAAKLGAALNGQEPAANEIQGEQCFEADLPLLGSAEAEEASRDPFARFDQQIRISPSVAGMVGLSVLGANRTKLVTALGASLVGIDPAQTRSDLVAVSFAITLVMQGMVWLSETPANPEIEDTSQWEGVEDVLRVDRELMDSPVAAELSWAWGTISECTRISSLAVIYDGKCVMQGGLFRRRDQGGIQPHLGALCEEVMLAKKGRYLAQLKSYPAKEQFLDFLPLKTQGLLLTPLLPARDAPAKGILICGVDAVRGVGKVDQAWLAALAEKLAVSLQEATAASASTREMQTA